MSEGMFPGRESARATPLDVLIVEDEPDIRASLADVLSDRGHHITAASNGAEAMALLDTRRFDIAICDVRLPKVNGLEIFHRIRHESPSSDVILMSAYGTVEEAVGAMKEKAAHYLAKPFRADILLDLVDRITDQKHLRRVLEAPDPASEVAIMGSSPVIVRVRELISTIALSDAAVLVTGESGTGKELVAGSLHAQSLRAAGPLVAVNCAAFPETLLEAELFGHERGAFTGAMQRRAGRFEAAKGGTLFLDEVAEMSLAAQVKLLRVLEQGACQRLGSNDEVPIDVRLISATNVDVGHAIESGALRADIYHRLKVFNIHLPPLRERRSDIPLLMKHMFTKLTKRPGTELHVTPAAWAALRHYDFPGNVRELRHVVEHALILGNGELIELEHLPEEFRGGATSWGARPSRLSLPDAVREFEKEFLLRGLQHCGGQKARTAELLGISRKTLWQKMKRYGIALDDD